MSAKVRTGRRRDVEAIATIHWRSAEAAYRGHGFDALLDMRTLEDRITRWMEIIDDAAPPTAVFLVERSGRPVGFVLVLASRDEDALAGVGEVATLYVDPDHWQHGVGRQLMERAVEHLTDAGFRRATLWVLESNARARRFYERSGWHPDGTSKTIDRGGHFTELRYEREL